MPSPFSQTAATPILRVGPSGWDYPHWESVVYPRPRPRGFHPLEFLASRFDTVEISQSFREAVRPELAKLWAVKTGHNRQFQFTARLDRLFSHERILEPARIAEWSAGLRPLLEMGKLGCVVMQFPSSFRFTAENKDFLIRLRRTFHEFPLTAELRHVSWTVPEAVGTLIDYHVGFCNIDQPPTVRSTPPTSLLTWRVGYVKLHGRVTGAAHDAFDDRAERNSGNDYLYSLAELGDWKARIEKILPFSQSTFVIFNNDMNGKSVVNGLQMQGLMRQPSYRIAKPSDRAESAGQAALFQAA